MYVIQVNSTTTIVESIVLRHSQLMGWNPTNACRYICKYVDQKCLDINRGIQKKGYFDARLRMILLFLELLDKFITIKVHKTTCILNILSLGSKAWF